MRELFGYRGSLLGSSALLVGGLTELLDFVSEAAAAWCHLGEVSGGVGVEILEEV